MLPYCPVIVSQVGEKFKIIDGQHRAEASKRTDNPIYYVITPSLTLKQIAIMNSRGEKWKMVDFLNCYIKLGLSDYEQISIVMYKHKVAIKTVIDLLMFYKHTEHSSTDLFQSGEFKCNHFEKTDQLLEIVHELFGRYTFGTDRYIIGAVMKIQEKGVCDFQKLKEKINMSPMMMDKQTDVKNYIYNIERVYNFKNHTRETIY